MIGIIGHNFQKGGKASHVCSLKVVSNWYQVFEADSLQPSEHSGTFSR